MIYGRRAAVARRRPSACAPERRELIEAEPHDGFGSMLLFDFDAKKASLIKKTGQLNYLI